MKITKRKLKKIIREALEQVDWDNPDKSWGPNDQTNWEFEQQQKEEKENVYQSAGLTPEEREITDTYLLDDDGMWLETSAYEKMFNYFMDLGIMPYEVATGDLGEPDLWILDYLREL